MLRRALDLARHPGALPRAAPENLIAPARDVAEEVRQVALSVDTAENYRRLARDSETARNFPTIDAALKAIRAKNPRQAPPEDPEAKQRWDRDRWEVGRRRDRYRIEHSPLGTHTRMMERAIDQAVKTVEMLPDTIPLHTGRAELDVQRLDRAADKLTRLRSLEVEPTAASRPELRTGTDRLVAAIELFGQASAGIERIPVEEIAAAMIELDLDEVEEDWGHGRLALHRLSCARAMIEETVPTQPIEEDDPHAIGEAEATGEVASGAEA